MMKDNSVNDVKGDGKGDGLALMMGVDSLVASVTNPRQHFDEDELARLVASVELHGILQPLVVRVGDAKLETWEIVCGERRWRAAKMAGLLAVPVQVRVLSDREVVEIQISENIDRDDLTLYEEARGVRSLSECGCTRDEIVDKLGRDERWVQTRFGIFDLPAIMQDRVRDGDYGARVVEQVLRVQVDEREGACQAVLELGVDVTESQVKDLLTSRYHAPNQRRRDWSSRFGKLFEKYGDSAEPIRDVEMVGEFMRPFGDPLGGWVRDDAAIRHEARLEDDEGILWVDLAAAHGIKNLLVPMGDVKSGEIVVLVDAVRVRGVEAAIRENGGETTLGARKVDKGESLKDEGECAGVGEVDGADGVDGSDAECDKWAEGEEIFTLSVSVPGRVLVRREVTVSRKDLIECDHYDGLAAVFADQFSGFDSDEEDSLDDYLNEGGVC